MNTTVFSMKPEKRTYNINGRQKLANVYFRIEVRPYTVALNDHSQEAGDASDAAVVAFDKEVVDVLLAAGWSKRTEKNYGPGDCPQMVKGAQYLYCHPHDISGYVNPDDVATLEAMFRNMTTCDYRWTDNYGNVMVTTSDEDERQMYLDYYPAGLAITLQDLLTTKRRNLYKDKGSAEHAVYNRVCIENRRIDLNEIGTGYPAMRTALTGYVESEWQRLKALGYIIEVTGANNRPLARWANAAERRAIEKKLKANH